MTTYVIEYSHNGKDYHTIEVSAETKTKAYIEAFGMLPKNYHITNMTERK